MYLAFPEFGSWAPRGSISSEHPRGPSRSREVSDDLVLEVSEHHFCGFRCSENHQGQPTSKVREAGSPSPYRETRSYREGRNWWSSLEIISHIHQLPEYTETKVDIFKNDLNFTLYQVRLFTKERDAILIVLTEKAECHLHSFLRYIC